MLSERKKCILKAIIDEYVATAEPVGSKALAERCGLGLSSATLRNEMADLEQLGFLEQPHTSAGRVPSHLGYRLYVNELMNRHRLTEAETAQLNRALMNRIREFDRMIFEAGRVISEMTHYTAVAISPRIEAGILQRFELIACAIRTYVILVVTGAGMVKNRVYHAQGDIDGDDLTKLANALNKTLSGIEPAKISLGQVGELEGAAGTAEELLDEVLDFIKDIMNDGSVMDLHLGGAANLLDYPEYRDVEKAHRLLDYLDDCRDTRWFTPSEKDRLTIRIGSENKAEPMKDASLIVASYNIADGAKGYIGVVGPTRMDYARIAAHLQFFADGLDRIIKKFIVGER